MLAINMSDVINVLSSIQNYLIVIAIAIVAAIVVVILADRISKEKKGLVRGSALIAMVLVITICVNLICTGPMSTMLDLVSGGGTIEDATAAEAIDLAVRIGEEGIVLLENDGDLLPLSSGDKLNVFGWASINPILGGAGSGALNDAYDTVGVIQSLNDAGIETNTELTQFYTNYKADRPVVGMWDQDWTLPEPNVSAYSEDLINNAKDFSDTALIFIARSGGEGADLPNDMAAVVDGSYKDGTTYTAATYDDTLNDGNDWDAGDHYLQLSNREEELVELVCANFDNVIFVYNGANAFELGFVKANPEIKSVLWTGGQGHVGMTALGRILAGTVNPSGRTIDTFVYELEETPWWNNFGDFNYTNMNEFQSTTSFGGGAVIPSFVNYVEGIYVGYRFYETAFAEQMAGFDYDSVVQYPFGYGLSYTTFTQTMGDVFENNGLISFDVTVTNTGDTAGKDVVEVYVNPPYTNGGIEKSAANLVQFEKTSVLQPGASETVHVSFSLEALTSYDYEGVGAYVLEAGDYIISINSDSHNVLDKKTASPLMDSPNCFLLDLYQVVHQYLCWFAHIFTFLW